MTGGARRPRTRQARGRSRVGERFEVEVDRVAHGGHCVARLPVPDSRVVFVRHALPGERVIIEITEGTDRDRFWRADAVAVTIPSPDRVEAPCRFAGPGGCGGCDFQHVSLPRQRALKADVVREQLRRLAGLDVEVRVEAVPLDAARPSPVQEPSGDVDGLGWRTRQRYVELPGGRRGMRKHRSHEVVEIDECLIEAPAARTAGGSSGPTVVESVSCRYGTHRFERASDGFWQVHPGAPAALVEAVMDLGAPLPGEAVLDLYAGAGLFSRFLADAVGADGRVVAVEGDAGASSYAARNLGGLAGVDAVHGDVSTVLASSDEESFDLVVLDPPRIGAKRAVVEQVVRRRPRDVVYVACDPAALARDVAIFAEHGYELERLRAFDLFPMTHHVECVVRLGLGDPSRHPPRHHVS